MIETREALLHEVLEHDLERLKRILPEVVLNDSSGAASKELAAAVRDLEGAARVARMKYEAEKAGKADEEETETPDDGGAEG